MYLDGYHVGAPTERHTRRVFVITESLLMTFLLDEPRVLFFAVFIALLVSSGTRLPGGFGYPRQ